MRDGPFMVALLLLAGAALTQRLRRGPDRLGEFFSWSEANPRGHSLSPDVQANIIELHNQVLDPLRRQAGQPLVITSWYRSPAENAAAGGSSASQHLTGQGADVRPPAPFDSFDLVDLLASSGLPFDQLIAYPPSRGGHVHVSYRRNGQNRRQIRWNSGPNQYAALTPGQRPTA